jgi:hypothetical protein
MIEAYPNKPGKSNIVSTSFRRTPAFTGRGEQRERRSGGLQGVRPARA